MSVHAITIIPCGRGRYDAAYAQCQAYPFAQIHQSPCGLVGVSPADDHRTYGSAVPEYTALFPDLAAALCAVMDHGGALWACFEPSPIRRPGACIATVCAALFQAGCRLVKVGLSGDRPTIEVDRRPNLPDLTPGCLRADAAGCHYQARLGPVRVAWTEARRRAA